jgi:hypothetical protein
MLVHSVQTLFPLFVHASWSWAVLSEALLAITHLKVLLCLGKPYPERELASKRWTYFLYDLASPWLSLAAALSGPLLLQLGSTFLAADAGLQGTAIAGCMTSPAQPLLLDPAQTGFGAGLLTSAGTSEVPVWSVKLVVG